MNHNPQSGQYLSGRRHWLAMFASLLALLIYAGWAMPGRAWARSPAGSFNPQQDVPQASTAGTATHHIQTVFIIMMENHSWTGDLDRLPFGQNIKGNPNAPYINDTLLPMSSYAGNYNNPPGNHPSQPNYLWLEAGTNFGLRQDTQPGQPQFYTHLHLVKLLENAGISWKAYAEGLGANVCPLNFSQIDVEHLPMVYFNDVNEGLNPKSPECIAHVRPYSELEGDLKNNTQAAYNFITPNTCDDMHSGCGHEGLIAQGDIWLSKNVPMILNSYAFQTGGALFIIWDEGDDAYLTDDGPVGCILLSPFAKGGGYTNQALYTHGSTLRTLEEIFGVTPLLRDANNQQDLSDLFSQFP